MKKITFSSLLWLMPLSAMATDQTENTWADEKHSVVRETLHDWSNDINEWLGETDPSRPASASLRVMADNQWNKIDGYSVKPRVRGKIKLPILKKHLKVVFGDDSLDDQNRDPNQTSPNYRQPMAKDKSYDGRQAREDNNSIALRWSNYRKSLGLETDLDAGIRSGSDIFGRLRLAKVWKWNETYSTRLENTYRYGTESKHFVKVSVENKLTENERRFINNHTYIDYSHDIDETTQWGNSLYRQHHYANYKTLSYGVFAGGKIRHKKPSLNTYGPYISYRQPILRKWLFIQPELNYYNNKDKNRSHTFGAFLRVEAIF